MGTLGSGLHIWVGESFWHHVLRRAKGEQNRLRA